MTASTQNAPPAEKMGMAERSAVVLHAEHRSTPGVEHPGLHQTYRHPRVGLETRRLGPLAPDRVRVKVVYAGLCGTDLHAVESNSDRVMMRPDPDLLARPQLQKCRAPG